MNIRKMTNGEAVSLSQKLMIPIPAGYGAAEPMAIVTLRGTLTKDKATYFLQGEADAVLSMECARCLRPVKVDLQFPVEESFCDTPGEDEWPVTDGAVDLGAALADNLLPQLSAKMLCREECKGLCSVCGKDLNDGDCGCQKDVGDERLAVLKQWFSDNETESI